MIPPIEVAAEGHVSAVKNGVRFDVYFDKGPKPNAAIYAINTGRKQLVLTPKQHKAILEDLIRRKFTVIVADFRDKKLAGPDLEKYVVRLTADAREVADGVLNPKGLPRPPAASKTDTFANDYFTLMPGFTVERDVTWFRYGDIPAAFRREIARQLDKPFDKADADKVNTFDIVYPVHGPAVGVLTNYASDEKGRENYYPLEDRYLVQAFALKNLAIVHQQYFNDPVGGYPKGYSYYGDQFAACFIRHLKGNASRYGDAQKFLAPVLKERRERAFVVTKCYEPDGEKALALLKQNLKELGIDRADLVYAHSIGADQMPPEKVFGKGGVCEALAKAKRDGLTRFVGVSGHNRPDRFLTAMKEWAYDVQMNAVGLAARHTYDFEGKVWPAAAKKGIGLAAMKVFGGAAGGGKWSARLPEELRPAAFRYALGLPNVAVVVLGMKNKDELKQNLEWLKEYKPLEKDELTALEGPTKELAKKWGNLYGAVN